MTLLDCVSLDFSEFSFAIRGLGSDPEMTALEDLTGVIFHPACPVEPDTSLQLHNVSFSIFSRGFEECFPNHWPSTLKKIPILFIYTPNYLPQLVILKYSLHSFRTVYSII